MFPTLSFPLEKEWKTSYLCITIIFNGTLPKPTTCCHYLLAGAISLEIVHRNEQHTKVFAVFLARMFVVDFVRPPNSQHIPICGVAQPLKTLVYDNVMHHKVRNAVAEYTNTDIQAEVVKHDTCHHQRSRRYGKDEKKSIVLLKKARLGLVMVAVE